MLTRRLNSRLRDWLSDTDDAVARAARLARRRAKSALTQR
jgi:hypothetical protein